MKRSKHFVLIYVDQKRRDLFPALKIEASLREAGIDAKAVGKFQFLAAIEFYKPTIIIYGKHDGYHGDWLRAISGGFIFSLNTEQGFSNLEVMRQVFLIGHEYHNEPAHEKIDCFLTYNKHTADWLTLNLPNANVEVVGSPRLYSKTLHVEPRQFTKEKLTVGIILGSDLVSGDAAFNYYNNYEKHIFPDFGGVQEFLSFHLIESILLRKAASKLNLHNKVGEIIVRARFDNSNEYLANYKNNIFKLDLSDDPQDFFSKVDIVIFFQSTLGFEAMMCGIPSVNLSPMININTPFNKVTSRNYVKTSHKASSLSELDSIVDLRSQNNLALADDLSEYVKIAKDYFYNQTFDDRFSERLVSLVAKLDNHNIASVDFKMIWHHGCTPRIAKFLLATTKIFRWSYKIAIKFSKFRYRKLSSIYFG